MDDILAPIQDLFEGQIVRTASAESQATLLIGYWIGLPRSAHRGDTVYGSFDYFRGWFSFLSFAVWFLGCFGHEQG